MRHDRPEYQPALDTAPDLQERVFNLEHDLSQLRQELVVARQAHRELKEVELALRESEEQHRTLLQAAIDAIFVYPVSPDGVPGTFTEVNDAACRRLGYRREELLRLSILDLYHGDLAKLRSNIQRLLDAQEVLVETHHRTRDGRLIPVEVTARLIELQHQPHILSIARDISERSRARDAMQARLREVEVLHSLTTHVARAHAPEEVYEFALNAVLDAIGCDRASLLLFDEDDVMRFKAWRGLSDAYRRAVEGHSPWTPGEVDPDPIVLEDAYEDPSLAAYRQVIVDEGIRAMAFIPLTHEGRLIGKFMLYFEQPHAMNADEIRLAQTIAHHVSFAIERQRADQALRQSEERYRQLSEVTSDYIFSYRRDADDQFYVEWISDAFERITGYTMQELASREQWGRFIHPDDYALVQDFMAEMHQNRSSVMEHRFIGKDNKIHWLRVFGRPVWDEQQGQVVRILGAGQDITAQKNAEAERERLLRELAKERTQLEVRVHERTQQVRTLAAKLSLAEHQERKRVSQILHDHVQQMLYGVQWRAHLLNVDAASKDPHAIEGHILEMRRLTDEAIRAARTLTVELSPPVLENEGLPETVAWLASQMKDLYTLDVLIEVQGDCRVADRSLRVLVYQIVRELLFNVVKHADVNQASVKLEEDAGQLSVHVEDKGKGFDVTALASSREARTGYGLSSIRERLELFGGVLNLQSSVKVGTQVSIVIPLDGR